MIAKVFLPPNPLTKRKSVFLAGSTEMGLAENWQQRVIKAVSEFDIDIFNPRRVDWDSSWEQTIQNKQFNAQVTWELDALDEATHILMYFDPATKSPISLLELGLYAATGKLIVVCPEGFWRKGNVDVVCQRYDIKVYDKLDLGLVALKFKLEYK